MERLRKLLRLSVADGWLLLKAALLLEVIKLSLRLLPFRLLHRLSNRATAARSRREGPHSADRVAWAVETASRYTPGVKTCLAQALTAQVMLARRGHPATLYIGVARGGEQLQAHAWVESGGRPVIGGHDLERYTLLAAL